MNGVDGADRSPAWMRWLGLGALTLLAFGLRTLIDVPGGVLDVDVVNFGLAALDFDVLQHQPHPPGYPGYALYLKAVASVAGALGPIGVALWGSRLMGAALVPAAMWACLPLSRPRGEGPQWAPWAAAAIACFHPLLWYYGGDGQSHGAEALATLLLFGGAARLRGRPGLAGPMALAGLMALAGSLRPTVTALNLPILLWALWGRPLGAWVGAAAAGLVGTALWWGPLVALSGGWGPLQRATDALVGGLFVSKLSPLAAGDAWLGRLAANLGVVASYGAIAASPLVLWRRGGGAFGWVIAAVGALSGLFYTLTFAVEAGYLTGLAALSCLVPASWAAGQGASRRGGRVRLGLAVAIPPLFLILGPASLSLPGLGQGGPLPTLAFIGQTRAAASILVGRTCQAAGGQQALVVSDNLVITHARALPLMCPGARSVVALRPSPFNPDLNGWLVLGADGLIALPTGIPLEAGPSASVTLPGEVELVMVGVDASESLLRDIARQATCAPMSGWPSEPSGWPSAPVIWPAACVATLSQGGNTLHIPPMPPLNTP